MPKPATIPTWATTTNFSTSPDPAAVGQPTKEDPSSVAAEGWNFVVRPRPTFQNFWQNAVGVWLTWLNDFAIDGENGGIYAPSAIIVLTANGINLTAGAGLLCDSTSAMNVKCVAHFESDSTINIDGPVNLAAGSATTYAVAADETHENIPIFHNGAIFSVAGTIDVSSAVAISTAGTLAFTGAGHKLDRVSAGANGNASYAIGDADEIIIPVQTGADHTYTLSTTGATTGARMKFSAYGNTGSFYVQIATAEATVFLRNVAGGAGGLLTSLEVVYFGGAWHISAATPCPAL